MAAELGSRKTTKTAQVFTYFIALSSHVEWPSKSTVEALTLQSSLLQQYAEFNGLKSTAMQLNNNFPRVVFGKGDLTVSSESTERSPVLFLNRNFVQQSNTQIGIIIPLVLDSEWPEFFHDLFQNNFIILLQKCAEVNTLQLGRQGLFVCKRRPPNLWMVFSSVQSSSD